MEFGANIFASLPTFLSIFTVNVICPHTMDSGFIWHTKRCEKHFYLALWRGMEVS